jgi:hypothetical protein
LFNKDIPDQGPNSTGPVDVLPVINGMDAYKTARVTTNDPGYIPEISSIIAMDVNRDRKITSGDISQIKQRAVLARNEFTQVDNAGNLVSSPTKDWLFLGQDEMLSNPEFRSSSVWPFDDGLGYSKNRVPFVHQEFTIPFRYGPGNLNCPQISDKTYLAVMVGDADGSYKNYSELGTGLKLTSLKDGVVKISLYKSATDIKATVSFHSSVPVVAFDMSMVLDGTMLSYSLEADGMCFQNGKKINCISYGLDSITEANNIITMQFGNVDFNDIQPQYALINGKPFEYEVDYIEAPASFHSNNISGVSFYPSPASDKVYVILENEAEIFIYNISGQRVLRTRAYNGSTTIDVQNLNPGIYQFVVIQGNNISTNSVVVE